MSFLPFHFNVKASVAQQFQHSETEDPQKDLQSSLN